MRNMFESLVIDVQDGVALLTLNEPQTRNAMSERMTAEFPQAIAQIGADASVRGLIITGAGSAFCAGGDLAMLERMLDQTQEENRREMGRFYRQYLSVLDLDIPTIAALNGAAIGAGLAFTLGCDMRVAARDAKLGITFLNLGLYPGMGSVHLLTQTIGANYAADLVLTGRIIDGDEAYRIGLVNRVTERAELLDAARALMKQIVDKPASSMRMAKRSLVAAKVNGLEEALDREAFAQMASYSSPDMRATLAKMKARA